GWASAAGASLAQPSTAFEVDKWYMFTFTVKSSINRKMALRMGLRTDQAHSWIDDFDGVSAGNKLNLTQDYVTYNFFFKLNSLMSSSGEQVFKIELNLGLVDYDYNPVGSVVTFKDVNIFKVISDFLPPTVERQYGAELPVKLTAGDPLPTNFADYVVASDMEGNILVPTIDSSLVNMAVPGTYAVSYSVTDSREATTTFSIDFTVVAAENEDTTGPVVTLKPGIPTEIDQFTPAVDLRQVVDAVDAVDGTIIVTSDMIDSGGLNFNVAGVYTVLFSVYDLSGNVGTLSVDVTILDKQAPVINASDATITYGDEFDPLDIISVLDNLDGAIAVENVTVTGADAFLEEGVAKAVGSFDITYTVSDAAGNEGTVTVTITVMDVVWNNEGALPLTIPADEGPTHSTIAYDETEEAYKISGIDVDVDPWDHARLVYYFSKNDIKYGGLYKFVITAKADTATDLYFWLGTTLTADPWIDSFSGVDKKVVQITDQYVTYEVLFTADSESYASLNTWNAAKMQFMYGYLPTDATNNIYIKEFKLVPAAETTYVELHDLAPNDVLTGTLERSTQTVDTIEDAVALSGIPAYTNDWSTGRLTNYYNNTRLEFGETYRFKITVKATTATTLKFRIGTVLSTDPWIDNFAGGLQAISITDEYATYYVEFTVDKENYVSVNNAKFEFTYGYLDDTANTIYIKEFVLEKVIAPVNVDLVLIDDFDYADDAALEAEWTQRTNSDNKIPAPLLNYDAENKAMVFEMPATANDGWHIARKYDSLASFGATDSYKYLAFYMTNNTSKTSAHVWLYWSGNQNSY
ncbi:MAG: HYR domain-containing protein, partial [Sphaerochaeta sp.]|nr:HYR domain-containing protein [Sphaerochaeta sp.]